MKYEIVTYVHKDQSIKGYGVVIRKRNGDSNVLFNSDSDEFFWIEEREAEEAAKDYIKRNS